MAVIKAGGTGEDRASGLVALSDGSVLLAGSYEVSAGFGDVTLTSAGEDDIFLARVNSDGSYAWINRAGGTRGDGAHALVSYSDDSCLIAGYFHADAVFGPLTHTSAGRADVFIARVNRSGDFGWSIKAGGTEYDSAEAASALSDGGAIVAGYFEKEASFGSFTLKAIDEFDQDGFISKVDADGAFQWAASVRGSQDQTVDGVATLSDGSAVITGTFTGEARLGEFTLTTEDVWDTNAYIAKLNANGQFEWAQRIAGNNWITIEDIASTKSDDLLITGAFADTAAFGETTITSSGSSDVFAAQFNSNGQFTWITQAGGDGDDIGHGIASFADGAVLITGEFAQRAVFGDAPLTTTATSDAFAAKLTKQGEFEWAAQSDGTELSRSARGFDASTWSDGTSLVTGYFRKQATFGGRRLNANMGGDGDVFMASLDVNGLWTFTANTPPSGRDSTVSILEDNVHTFSASDFGFSDNDGDAFSAVKITTLPENGLLKVGDKNVAIETSIAAANLDKLQFIPSKNAHGDGYASIGFKVQDDGGTAGGGVDTDPTVNTLQLDVESVNDAPAGRDREIDLKTSLWRWFSAADFGFSDGDGDQLSAVQITSLPASESGRLSLFDYNPQLPQGRAINRGDFIAAKDLSKVIFFRSWMNPSQPSFTFKVVDDGGTANGGVAIDPTPNMIRLDAPPLWLEPDFLNQMTAAMIGEMQPEQVKNWRAKHVQSVPARALKGLTADQLAQLHPKAFIKLQDDQLAALTIDALTGLTCDQAESLSPQRIVKLGKAIAGVSGSAIVCLNNNAINARTKQQVKAQTIEQGLALALLRSNQFMSGEPMWGDLKNGDVLKVLKAREVALIQLKAIRSWEIEDLALIPANAFKGFSADQLGAMKSRSSLSEQQIRMIKPEAMAAFTAKDLKALTVKKFQVLSKNQLAALDKNAVAEIRCDHAQTLTTDEIKTIGDHVQFLNQDVISCLKNKTIKALTDEQVDALTFEQIYALGALMYEQLYSLQVPWLNPFGFFETKEQRRVGDRLWPTIDDIRRNLFPCQLDIDKPESWPKDPPLMVKEALKSFTNPGLTIDQLKGLSPGTISKWAADDIRKIPPAAFKGLTALQLNTLSDSSIRSLSPVQIGQFRDCAVASLKASDLEIFSSPQLQALGTKISKINPKEMISTSGLRNPAKFEFNLLQKMCADQRNSLTFDQVYAIGKGIIDNGKKKQQHRNSFIELNKLNKEWALILQAIEESGVNYSREPRFNISELSLKITSKCGRESDPYFLWFGGGEMHYYEYNYTREIKPRREYKFGKWDIFSGGGQYWKLDSPHRPDPYDHRPLSHRLLCDADEVRVRAPKIGSLMLHGKNYADKASWLHTNALTGVPYYFPGTTWIHKNDISDLKYIPPNQKAFYDKITGAKQYYLRESSRWPVPNKGTFKSFYQTYLNAGGSLPRGPKHDGREGVAEDCREDDRNRGKECSSSGETWSQIYTYYHDGKISFEQRNSFLDSLWDKDGRDVVFCSVCELPNWPAHLQDGCECEFVWEGLGGKLHDVCNPNMAWFRAESERRSRADDKALGIEFMTN